MMGKTNPKATARIKRVSRIRKKIVGTSERPRLRVFKSSKHIYAQIIDDSVGKTITYMSTIDKEFDKGDVKGKIAAAEKVGELLAIRAKAFGIQKVVFDRGGFIYHGRIKAVSEGARKNGLQF
ncbi:MAG: 50S ribosomal protein L18 [Desulfobulbaceae bacterium]|nr:50S ribosomal protein L18 [Desulfobulbaceae bacterium]